MTSINRRFGHRPIFPSYTREDRTERRLAIIEQGIVTELNGTVHRFNNVSELCSIVHLENLLSFIEDFTSEWFYEYLETLVCSSTATVMSNRYGEVSSIRIRFGRTTRWIVLSSSWGQRANRDFIQGLSRLFSYIDTGCYGTPGSAGMAIIRKTWRENKLDIHTSPSSAACDYIYKHQFGGRVDTPGIGKFFDQGIDYDQAVSYLAHNMVEPTSTSVRFNHIPSDRYYTWFGECVVTITSELALGSFPVRLRNGRVVYPTLPGRYVTHVWKEEYERIISSGCKVEINGGYGWRECTMDTLPWCQYMYSLKNNAPDELIENFIKTIIVATIGRYGMKGDFSTVVHMDDAEPEDEPVVTRSGELTFFCIHKEKNKNAIPMPHWANYTTRMSAIETYDFALPFAEQGELIATNYDSVLVLNTKVVPNTYSKLNNDSCPPGSWRWQLLNQIYVPSPRSVVCLEKIRLPGVRIDSPTRF